MTVTASRTARAEARYAADRRRDDAAEGERSLRYAREYRASLT